MAGIDGVRVVRSPIHGYGAIATRTFELGDVIAAVEGVLWRAEALDDDTYALWIDDGWLYDMVCQTRWINHSCEPNAGIEAGYTEAGDAWAQVVARRPIAAGDELSYDYAFSVDEAEPCHCGTNTCRGVIADEDELRSGAPVLPPRQTVQSRPVEPTSVGAGIRVARSGVHGYGVFAIRDFAAGEVVSDVEGVLCADEEIVDDTYALWIEDGWVYDMVCPTRWVNHSCEPNSELEAGFGAAGQPWARIVAVRAIPANEEIAYAYAFPPELAEPCSCGAASCNGWIIDADGSRRERRQQAAQRRTTGGL